MDNSIIESLRQALRSNPDNMHLRLALAQALLDGGSYEEAETEYVKAVSIEPDGAEPKTGLAQAYYAQGKFSAVLVVCEELVKTGKASARTYLVFAKALHQREEYKRASKMYEKSKSLDTGISDPLLDSLTPYRNAPEQSPFSLEYADGDPGGKFEPYFEKPAMSFADVGGMEDLKEEIRLKIIHPLASPKLYAAYGKKIGGGILMYGPPGCGKTYIAKATAGEAKANFISVGISDVLDMYTGQSEKNLHEIFESARERKPSILFFDEIDALGASRRDMRQSASRQVINQFLAELDGIESDNEGVLVLAATNAPWHLDGAFRRPGRFDRIIFVPPPDREARTEILKIMLKGKPAGDVDADAVTKKMNDFSGADINALVESAVEVKLRDALKTGKPEPLTTKLLLQTAKKIKPTTRGWFTTAKNHALYANEDGLYNDILKHLKIK